VLLPDAALRVAEDLRTRAGLSLSYDAIASRREYWFKNNAHKYKWPPSWPRPSPPFVTDNFSPDGISAAISKVTLTVAVRTT
jgi:hypothetical protein